VRPPVHVYQKAPEPQAAPAPSYSAPPPSYKAPAPKPSYNAPAPKPSYNAPAPKPSYNPPAPSYSQPKPSYNAPNRYKAAKKSDNGRYQFGRYEQQFGSNSGKSFLAGLNNIFSGASPPSAEPRAKLEEIQAPDLSPASSNIREVVVKSKQSFASAPVAQARIDTNNSFENKDRSAVVRAVVSVADSAGNLVRRGTVTDITNE
jgi:hypothetical protein